ncbi:MAG: hypothetical protein KGZ58_08970, partial [Ignavibacteriales bacterium]|nr:hypothetical protein [Ignavibacteriales bacterium]
MSTQAPAPVQSFSDTSIEKIAYKSVESIPTQEPNDRSRLGYHVWLWLTTKEGTLEESVRSAGSRMLVSY